MKKLLYLIPLFLLFSCKEDPVTVNNNTNVIYQKDVLEAKTSDTGYVNYNEFISWWNRDSSVDKIRIEFISETNSDDLRSWVGFDLMVRDIDTSFLNLQRTGKDNLNKSHTFEIDVSTRNQFQMLLTSEIYFNFTPVTTFLKLKDIKVRRIN